MENTKILVLENDHKEIPSWLSSALGKRVYDVWYDFSMSFHWDREGSFERLKNLDKDVLLVTTPSFAGQDNQFSGYLLLFSKLKDMGISVNLAIMYTESFYVYLLKFLSDEQGALKKENNHRLLKEVLDFHTVYEIPFIDYVPHDLSDMTPITYARLMQNYIETHRKLNPTEFVYKDGNTYPAYRIDYKYPVGESEVTLMVPDDYNNNTKLKDLTWKQPR